MNFRFPVVDVEKNRLERASFGDPLNPEIPEPVPRLTLIFTDRFSGGADPPSFRNRKHGTFQEPDGVLDLGALIVGIDQEPIDRVDDPVLVGVRFGQKVVGQFHYPPAGSPL